METSKLRKRMPVATSLDPKIVVPAIGQLSGKLNPRTIAKNPVMFVLEMVAAIDHWRLVRDIVVGGQTIAFEFQIVIWLWFTVFREFRGSRGGGTR